MNDEKRKKIEIGTAVIVSDDPLKYEWKPAVCRSEDSHQFDSTGQCAICRAHRRPA